MDYKQVVVTGKEQVELQTLIWEETEPAADELWIETESTFISAGTELSIYTAKEHRVYEEGAWCAYPYKSGYANVGIIRQVGADVNQFQPGQRVFTLGNHAQWIRCKMTDLIVPVPDGVSVEQASASRMVSVAATGVIVSELTQHDWVVIFGLGMVGNFAAQAFQLKGCRVIGVDPVLARRQLAKECGIEHVVGGSSEEVRHAIRELTGKDGADIVVDAVGHTNVIKDALQVTRKMGQLVLLGSPRVEVQGNITEVLSQIHLNNITVRGALEWCLPTYSNIAGQTSLYSKQTMIFDWILHHKIAIQQQVSHVINPRDIKEAYEGLLHHPQEYTGVVLDWRRL